MKCHICENLSPLDMHLLYSNPNDYHVCINKSKMGVKWNNEMQAAIDEVMPLLDKLTINNEFSDFYIQIKKDISEGPLGPKALTGELQEGLKFIKREVMPKVR